MTNFVRHRTVARDLRGKEVVLAWYLGQDQSAEMQKLLPLMKKGNCLAVRNAKAHGFMDGSFGVREESSERTTVLACT